MSKAWLDDTVMSRRGVGANRSPVTHHLTEEMQKKFHYTVGPYSEPVLSIEPGDRVIVDTRDAFEGKIQKETDIPSKILELPYLNPQNGPILVAGAEKGDVLAVHIEEMLPRGDDPHGICCMIPFFGGLSSTDYTASLHEPLPEIVRRIKVDRNHVYWSKKHTLAYKPHIGTLSVSPEIDSINALVPDNHGGNMDIPDIGPGSITYLPIRSPGARLFIGDAHACQGDGEVCGTAVEFSSTTTIRVDLIKNWKIEWPRMENETSVMGIGSARPLEDATRIAYRELIRWLVEDYQFDQWDAYMMLSQCGKVRLGNFVDPKYSVGAMLDKSYLSA
ncbi:MAG: acetamidase/formamidase family protein [Castellaniella sp.]